MCTDVHGHKKKECRDFISASFQRHFKIQPEAFSIVWPRLALRPANLSLFGDNRRFLGQLDHLRESCRTGEFFLRGGEAAGWPSACHAGLELLNNIG